MSNVFSPPRHVEAQERLDGIAPHYACGDMSLGEWGRYGYRHVDHHLRQFGA